MSNNVNLDPRWLRLRLWLNLHEQRNRREPTTKTTQLAVSDWLHYVYHTNYVRQLFGSKHMCMFERSSNEDNAVYSAQQVQERVFYVACQTASGICPRHLSALSYWIRTVASSPLVPMFGTEVQRKVSERLRQVQKKWTV